MAKRLELVLGPGAVDFHGFQAILGAQKVAAAIKNGFIPAGGVFETGGASRIYLVCVLIKLAGLSIMHTFSAPSHPRAISVFQNTRKSKRDDKNWRGSQHLPRLCVPSRIPNWRRECAGTHSGMMSKWTP